MDVSSIDKRLELIETRLSRIETHLNLTMPAITTPEEPKTVAPITQIESQIKMSSSGNWLGVIAIICFIVAAGFIVKLSIESGWLTPARQIAIAVLFGFSLIGVGIWLLESDKEYISLLPASGIIVLYLSTFAAYRLYALMPFEIAMMTCGAISLLCIILYLKIRHDIYPLTAAIGAYLSPVIMGFDIETVFTLYYFVISSLTFSIISIWVKSRILTILSAYLAILATAYVGIDLHQAILISFILALQFIIFSMGAFVYTIYTKNMLTEQESWGFFPVLLIFYVTEYYFLSQNYHDLASWLSLAFAGFLIILYLIARTGFGLGANSQSMIVSFVSIVLFHAGYLELLPAVAGPWLFVVIILSLALLLNRINSIRNNNIFLIPIFIIFFIILSIEYVKMVYNIFTYRVVDWIPLWLSIFSIWTLFILQRDLFDKDESYGYTLLGLAHLLVVLSLYRFANDYGSLAVSLSWLIYAVGIIIFAFIRKDKVMANSALFVLFFSAAKALLYDAASAPTTIRILCLLITGVVLYGSGFLFRKIAKWKS